MLHHSDTGSYMLLSLLVPRYSRFPHEQVTLRCLRLGCCSAPSWICVKTKSRCQTLPSQVMLRDHIQTFSKISAPPSEEIVHFPALI